MESFLLWFQANWFTLLQTVGIVGGLLFTAVSVRQSTKARRASDLLSLTQQHRELWAEVYTRGGLERIFAEEADLVGNPVTVAEDRFLNQVIVHFQTGWELSRNGFLLPKMAIEKDVRSFFSLPLPRFVWKQSREGRDPEFVRFIEEALGESR